ncbi:hypothetical protein I4U23_023157 [Adineta vaga]|nr:hypothetical protein I4U23_023157 [Adineta vaga]
MDFFRKPRETLMQGIGILAATLSLSGMRVSNNEFNDRFIKQYRCSQQFKDEMTIRRFYVYETLIRHNFVVFQTDTGHTFKVHLIADVDPGHHTPVFVEIAPTYWRPDGRYVKKCNKKPRDLKNFVKYEVKKFGTYEVGINDCRHFARAVARFLSR